MSNKKTETRKVGSKAITNREGFVCVCVCVCGKKEREWGPVK